MSAPIHVYVEACPGGHEVRWYYHPPIPQPGQSGHHWVPDGGDLNEAVLRIVPWCFPGFRLVARDTEIVDDNTVHHVFTHEVIS